MKPDIKKYIDVFHYLQDIYSYRKNHKSKFSYEIWSKELSINNKAYLRLIILGKRPISAKVQTILIKNLNLTSEEEEYFRDLVEYSQCKTEEQKKVFGQRLISHIKQGSEYIEIISHIEFLSDPLLPKLQTMLSFTDLDQSAQNLSWLLGTTEDIIKKSIEKLLKLKLIVKIKQRYSPVKKSFKVPDHFRNVGLENYYKSSFRAAEEAIQIPTEQRRFRSLLLPLNQNEFDSYLESLQKYIIKQLNTYNADEFTDRRLYQVHFHIIPVSQNSSIKN